MWQAFELMHKTFKAGAELYLEGKQIVGNSPFSAGIRGTMTKREIGPETLIMIK